MSVLFKAILAFTVVPVAGGRFCLEAPRGHAVAANLAAAYPQAALTQQIHHFSTGRFLIHEPGPV